MVNSNFLDPLVKAKPLPLLRTLNTFSLGIKDLAIDEVLSDELSSTIYMSFGFIPEATAEEIVLPITSQKENKNYYKFDILISKSDKNWLSQNSVIKLEQIKTVSKLRIWDYIWTLEDEYKEVIEQKIHKLFL